MLRTPKDASEQIAVDTEKGVVFALKKADERMDILRCPMAGLKGTMMDTAQFTWTSSGNVRDRGATAPSL